MEFLADESCDHTIINHLRTAGIDVLSISEKSPGISDKEVLVFAQEQERILITEDRDFGRLVHLGGENSTSRIISPVSVQYPSNHY